MSRLSTDGRTECEDSARILKQNSQLDNKSKNHIIICESCFNIDDIYNSNIWYRRRVQKLTDTSIGVSTGCQRFLMMQQCESELSRREGRTSM